MIDCEEGVDWHADGEDVPRWVAVTYTFGMVALILLGGALINILSKGN